MRSTWWGKKEATADEAAGEPLRGEKTRKSRTNPSKHQHQEPEDKGAGRGVKRLNWGQVSQKPKKERASRRETPSVK